MTPSATSVPTTGSANNITYWSFHNRHNHHRAKKNKKTTTSGRYFWATMTHFLFECRLLLALQLTLLGNDLNSKGNNGEVFFWPCYSQNVQPPTQSHRINMLFKHGLNMRKHVILKGATMSSPKGHACWIVIYIYNCNERRIIPLMKRKSVNYVKTTISVLKLNEYAK